MPGTFKTCKFTHQSFSFIEDHNRTVTFSKIKRNTFSHESGHAIVPGFVVFEWLNLKNFHRLFFKQGCYDSIKDKLKQYATILIVVGIVIGCLEVHTTSFSLIPSELACKWSSLSWSSSAHACHIDMVAVMAIDREIHIGADSRGYLSFYSVVKRSNGTMDRKHLIA